MSAEDIRKRPLTERQLRTIDRIAKEQAAGHDSNINYEDIPATTDEQWSRRIPFRDRHRLKPDAKVDVSVSLDSRVLQWLGSKGKEPLKRINGILADVMEAERNTRPSR